MVKALALWPLVVSTASAAFLPGWFNPITYLPLPGYTVSTTTTSLRSSKTTATATPTASTIKSVSSTGVKPVSSTIVSVSHSTSRQTSTSSTKTVKTSSSAKGVDSTLVTKSTSTSLQNTSGTKIATISKPTTAGSSSTSSSVKVTSLTSLSKTAPASPSSSHCLQATGPGSSRLTSGSKVSSLPGTGTAAGLCTITVLTTATITPYVTTTTTSISSDIYLGDDGIPVDPATVPVVFYSSFSTTGTKTFYYTVTSSPIATTTVLSAASFRPVQDTLPSVTFVPGVYYSNPLDGPSSVLTIAFGKRAATCTSTVTSTSTSTVTAEPQTTTVTVVTTDTFIVWLAESTTAEALTYIQNARTVIPTTTTTFSYTDYSAYEFLTSTVYSPTGPPSSTTTLYAACSSSNFANYKQPLKYNDGTSLLVGGFSTIEGTQPVRAPDTDHEYECCSQAMQAGAAGWAWSLYYYSSCSLLTTTVCSGQSGNQLAATYNDTSLYRTFVVGNGPCGEWTTIDTLS